MTCGLRIPAPCSGKNRNSRIPRVAIYPKLRYVFFFFFLSKPPGGSDPNRVFSLSVLKIDFFRDTLFFQVEDRSEAQPLPCKYSEKSATLRRCCARTACQAARFSVERLDKDSNNRNPSAPYDLSANCGDIAARTCAFLQ